MKKYTYNDWLTEKVVLGYNVYIPKDVEKPLTVLWEDFIENDVELIQKEQERILYKLVDNKSKHYKSIFDNKIKKSLNIEECIENELRQCMEILQSNKHFVGEYWITKFWSTPFTVQSIITIENFYQDQIVKGGEKPLHIIHPENSVYQNQADLDDLVLTWTLWNYYNWLKPKARNLDQPSREYTNNEIALAYLLELNANGKQVPQNLKEGGLAKKIIMDIASKKYGMPKPDSFYRSVKAVLQYDLNKKSDLEQISLDWLGAVKAIVDDYVSVSKYLKNKGLIVE